VPNMEKSWGTFVFYIEFNTTKHPVFMWYVDQLSKWRTMRFAGSNFLSVGGVSPSVNNYLMSIRQKWADLPTRLMLTLCRAIPAQQPQVKSSHLHLRLLCLMGKTLCLHQGTLLAFAALLVSSSG